MYIEIRIQVGMTNQQDSHFFNVCVQPLMCNMLGNLPNMCKELLVTHVTQQCVCKTSNSLPKVMLG